MKNRAPVISDHEAAIFEHLLLPGRSDLPKGVARYFLSLQFPAYDISRINELSAKARQGALSSAEGDQLDSYLRVSSFVSIMKSNARRSLKAAGDSG